MDKSKILKPNARARYENYKASFFNTIALPSDCLRNFGQNKQSEHIKEYCSRFGKFRIDLPNGENIHEDIIVHLAKKIILRGRVTKISQKLEEDIKKITKANASDFNYQDAKAIFDQLRIFYNQGYSTVVPDQWHDGQPRAEMGGMSPEEYFYKNIIIPRLKVCGNKLTKSIIPQMYFSALTGIDSKDDRRVDFFIDCGMNKNNKIVVEIDDSTHHGHDEKDAERDNLLLGMGIKTYRIIDTDLVSNGSTLKEFVNHLNLLISPLCPNTSSTYELNDASKKMTTYFNSIRFAHIFQTIILAIASNYGMQNKKIFISPECRLNLSSDIISNVASSSIQDLNELCSNLSNLYKKHNPLEGLQYTEKIDNADFIISMNRSNANGINILYQEIIISDNFNNFSNIFPESPIIKSPDEKVLKNLLEYIFGFSDFREKQIDGIVRSLEGNDSIVLLPTGSGKSIVYQFLSFIVPGCTVVVAPLKSLIKDQVENLELKGIDVAGMITSDLTENEKKQATYDFRNGLYSIMYLAPERIEMNGFQDDIRQAKSNGVIFPICAIDEAHCISEWGHDFRTSYLSIADRCRKFLKQKDDHEPVILALTGTASDTVLKDMEDVLGIDEYSVIKPGSFDRKELHFRIYKTDTIQKKYSLLRNVLKKEIPQLFKKNNIEEVLKQNGENSLSGIIFCPYGKSKQPYGVDMVYNNLKEDLIPDKYLAKFYSSNNKSLNEGSTLKEEVADFKKNKKNLLVSTKAFGMGIDKPNVRYIIHNGISSSIEAFYQEVGRAGRDKDDAYGILLYTENDWNRDMGYSQRRITEIVMPSDAANGDDITAQIFLLKNNYNYAKDLEASRVLLEKINQLQQKEINISIRGENDYRGKTPSINDYKKSIYRLKVLRIIQDYSILQINGDCAEYKLVVNDYNPDDIVKAYGNYVRRYQSGQDGVRMGQLQKYAQLEPIDFALKAMEHLLDFQLSTIANNSLQAIRNMAELARRASQSSDPVMQDRIIREIIRDYLNTKNEDVLSKIANSPSELSQSVKILKEISNHKKYQDILSAAKRMRETDATNPSLRLFTIMLDSLSSQDTSLSAKEVNSFIEDTINMYGLDKEKTEQAVVTSISNIYQRAEHKEIYIDFIHKLSKLRGSNFKETLIEALPPPYVKPIVADCYIEEVEEIIKKIRSRNYYG